MLETKGDESHNSEYELKPKNLPVFWKVKLALKNTMKWDTVLLL